MKPEKRNNGTIEFERVKTNVFISGIIEDIQRDKERVTVFKGKESVKDCVRLKFALDGYQYPKYSRWLTFSYGAKSRLFQTILKPLVPNAKPDMDFDLESLKGVRVKTFWSQEGEYQNLQLIVRDEEVTNGVTVDESEEAPI